MIHTTLVIYCIASDYDVLSFGLCLLSIKFIEGRNRKLYCAFLINQNELIYILDFGEVE